VGRAKAGAEVKIEGGVFDSCYQGQFANSELWSQCEGKCVTYRSKSNLWRLGGGGGGGGDVNLN